MHPCTGIQHFNAIYVQVYLKHNQFVFYEHHFKIKNNILS